MEIVTSLKNKKLAEAPSVVLTLGVFDGVHLGHRRVLDTVIGEAGRVDGTSAVLTFDPHPRRVLRGENEPKILTSVDHKLRLLADTGLDFCIILKFDREFSKQSASSFIENRLLPFVDLKEVVIGPRFGFGCERGGDVGLLRELGRRHDFTVKVLEPLIVDGVHVSATAVRELIERGELDRAGRFLGRPYSIVGKVVRGKALGGKLGVPTANLEAEGEVMPPAGVYAVCVLLRGRRLSGVLNIDFNGVIEVHIIDFNKDIYGETIEVVFHKYVREEMTFASLRDLVQQIRTDIEIAGKILHNGEDLCVKIDREQKPENRN
jgi:riboflavin kinase/FMN adenylyltransferase